jgi:pimeloyl-ACP methyl ester carboxylesterase
MTTANGIEVCYDEFGSPADPALLLIMGYTAQMTAWEVDFCTLLASKGYRVIRFDNRDCGLSSKTDAPLPQLIPKADADAPGPLFTLAEPPPYTLDDMAADAVGLLDALGIERAHIVGASMGGMIAQAVAANHPDRVLSLTSIMSTTGNPDVGRPTDDAIAGLLSPVPPEREAVMDRAVAVGKVVAGPLFDEALARQRAGEAYDRSFHPIGAMYQMAAIAAVGDRTDKVARITCPTLVIHGAADTLITLSGGEATAAAIPDAKLLVLEQMGHNLPRPLWPDVADAIAENAARANSPGH